jgi:hypothetical protein
MNLYEYSVIIEDKKNTFNAQAVASRLAREARGQQPRRQKSLVQAIMLVLAGLAGK